MRQVFFDGRFTLLARPTFIHIYTFTRPQRVKLGQDETIRACASAVVRARSKGSRQLFSAVILFAGTTFPEIYRAKSNNGFCSQARFTIFEYISRYNIDQCVNNSVFFKNLVKTSGILVGA